ncbi:MAG: sigma-70 family RNA polymerase sigma factor [Oscillospiraceae bacterium]|nr:sigma-70 family RNA polymerase sigma factor [Oscillospiraceae bacterium]
MMKYAEEHPEFDMRSITVFAEDDYFEEFSYATEQLSYDAVISVLLQTIKALEIIKESIPGNWAHCISWTKDRLAEVWRDRGPFPGLGSMLSAVGFRCGEIMAKELENSINRFAANLPQRERNVFIRRYFFMETTEEIGKRYSLSANNAAVILHRVRKKLKKHLEKEGFV